MYQNVTKGIIQQCTDSILSAKAEDGEGTFIYKYITHYTIIQIYI